MVTIAALKMTPPCMNVSGGKKVPGVSKVIGKDSFPSHKDDQHSDTGVEDSGISEPSRAVLLRNSFLHSPLNHHKESVESNEVSGKIICSSKGNERYHEDNELYSNGSLTFDRHYGGRDQYISQGSIDSLDEAELFNGSVSQIVSPGVEHLESANSSTSRVASSGPLSEGDVIDDRPHSNHPSRYRPADGDPRSIYDSLGDESDLVHEILDAWCGSSTGSCRGIVDMSAPSSLSLLYSNQSISNISNRISRNVRDVNNFIGDLYESDMTNGSSTHGSNALDQHARTERGINRGRIDGIDNDSVVNLCGGGLFRTAREEECAQMHQVSAFAPPDSGNRSSSMTSTPRIRVRQKQVRFAVGVEKCFVSDFPSIEFLIDGEGEDVEDQTFYENDGCQEDCHYDGSSNGYYCESDVNGDVAHDGGSERRQEFATTKAKSEMRRKKFRGIRGLISRALSSLASSPRHMGTNDMSPDSVNTAATSEQDSYRSAPAMSSAEIRSERNLEEMDESQGMSSPITKADARRKSKVGERKFWGISRGRSKLGGCKRDNRLSEEDVEDSVSLEGSNRCPCHPGVLPEARDKNDDMRRSFEENCVATAGVVRGAGAGVDVGGTLFSSFPSGCLAAMAEEGVENPANKGRQKNVAVSSGATSDLNDDINLSGDIQSANDKRLNLGNGNDCTKTDIDTSCSDTPIDHKPMLPLTTRLDHCGDRPKDSSGGCQSEDVFSSLFKSSGSSLSLGSGGSTSSMISSRQSSLSTTTDLQRQASVLHLDLNLSSPASSRGSSTTDSLYLLGPASSCGSGKNSSIDLSAGSSSASLTGSLTILSNQPPLSSSVSLESHVSLSEEMSVNSQSSESGPSRRVSTFLDRVSRSIPIKMSTASSLAEPCSPPSAPTASSSVEPLWSNKASPTSSASTSPSSPVCPSPSTGWSLRKKNKPCRELVSDSSLTRELSSSAEGLTGVDLSYAWSRPNLILSAPQLPVPPPEGSDNTTNSSSCLAEHDSNSNGANNNGSNDHLHAQFPARSTYRRRSLQASIFDWRKKDDSSAASPPSTKLSSRPNVSPASLSPSGIGFVDFINRPPNLNGNPRRRRNRTAPAVIATVCTPEGRVERRILHTPPCLDTATPSKPCVKNKSSYNRSLVEQIGFGSSDSHSPTVQCDPCVVSETSCTHIDQNHRQMSEGHSGCHCNQRYRGSAGGNYLEPKVFGDRERIERFAEFYLSDPSYKESISYSRGGVQVPTSASSSSVLFARLGSVLKTDADDPHIGDMIRAFGVDLETLDCGSLFGIGTGCGSEDKRCETSGRPDANVRK